MGALDANVHYVKFVRGSTTAWATLLTTPNKISDDTLYFIYESVQNPTEGKLYLGHKLISGSGGGSTVSINDIGDVYIDNSTLADKQILVYNETSGQWENTSLSTIISTAVGTFTGATNAAAGTSGLVPAPHAGDQNKFLRGDGNWANITVPTFDSNIFDINANNNITLVGFAQAPVGSLPTKTNAGIEWAPLGAGTISRAITTMADLEDLISNGTADENTIYMVPAADVDSSNNYDEYMVVSGNLELIGTIGDVNLSDYVTTTTFNSAVGNINNILNDTVQGGITTPGLVSKVTFLQTKIGDLNNLILSTGNSTLVEEITTMQSTINDLDDRLLWHELGESD